jgi:recombination associated protein RdgC
MFFRNATFFQFPPASTAYWFDYIERDEGSGFEIDAPPAAAHLLNCAIKPVGPQELSSSGFAPPIDGLNATDEPTGMDLFVREGDTVWLTVARQDRMLPGSVVNDHLARKIAEVEEREGRKVGGRARKRLRDDLLHELLPRAFVRQRRTDALLFLDLGVLLVDTASRKAAEAVASEIRRALGSFPALPLNAKVATRSVLTGWVAGEQLPEPLGLGSDCELRDPMDGGARVKCTAQELYSDEIVKHLEAGKQCTRLALIHGEHLSFDIDETLVVRKLRFLDGAIQSLENTERDDLHAELMARFILNAAELRALWAQVRDAFKVSGVGA